MKHDTVSYKFAFCGGLTRRGVIERASHSIRDGIQHGLGYRLLDGRLLLPFDRRLEPEMADLLDVCVAIAMCDRRAPRAVGRQDYSSHGYARRNFDISIPVRHPQRWMSPEIRASVSRIAEMLTRDYWKIQFEQRMRDPRPAELQTPLQFESTMDNSIVALHSGGLDSLLGMAQVLAENEQIALIPVSVITHFKTRRVIDQVTASLCGAFSKASIHGSCLRFQSSRGEIDDRAGDYRTRILPCLAAGTAVAAALGDGRLHLAENGPGAINLPSSPEQLEAWTTRATHPKTLAEFANLAKLVLDRDIHIVNAGLWQTKGQLASVLHDSRFEAAARLTVSCERFPYANADAPCGSCMSCLYRQMALHRAGMAHIDAERIALRNERLAMAAGHGQGIEASALALQLEHLKTLLVAANPYRELDAEYERIDEVLQVAESLGIASDDAIGSIVALYREFTAEVDAFLHANVLTFPQSKECAVAS